MKRLGRYDAFDKWEILCHHWRVPEAPHDTGTDQWGRQLVPKWHSAALAGGTKACLSYIAERSKPPVASIRDIPMDTGDQGIDEDLRRLAMTLGSETVRAAARDLIRAIVDPTRSAAPTSIFPDRISARLKEVFKFGSLEALKWTLDEGEVPDLAILRKQAGPFPRSVLRHQNKALSLFSCRFRGRSDVIHLHDACVGEVTLVDNDADAMSDMNLIYPAHWTYVHSDYVEYLNLAIQSAQKWELVVADPWMTMSAEVAWGHLPTIAALCSETFITNYVDTMFRELQVDPADLEGLSRSVTNRTGVKVNFMLTMKRTAQVHWAVMTIGG